MHSFARICTTVQKPAGVLLYLLLTLDVFATGALRQWLHLWRWPFMALLSLCFVILAIAKGGNQQQSQESINE